MATWFVSMVKPKLLKNRLDTVRFGVWMAWRGGSVKNDKHVRLRIFRRSGPRIPGEGKASWHKGKAQR